MDKRQADALSYRESKDWHRHWRWQRANRYWMRRGIPTSSAAELRASRRDYLLFLRRTLWASLGRFG